MELEEGVPGEFPTVRLRLHREAVDQCRMLLDGDEDEVVVRLYEQDSRDL